ncbi:MAG: T9SS type A sorting domain-containing protein [Flavobacteriales bacterium]
MHITRTLFAFLFTVPVMLQAQEGLLDPSFSGDGKVTYDNSGRDENGVDIAVRPDGKIWVTGNSYDGGADTETILLMRYNSDGTPDNTFFGDGVEELSQGTGYTFSTCMVLQADGSLLIGGYYIDDLGYSAPLVIKVDANGNPVPGFGTNGFALGPADGYRVTDLGVQSTGDIVITVATTLEIVPGVYSVTSSGTFGSAQHYILCSNNNKFIGLQVLENDHVLITGYHGYDSTSTQFRTLILALNADLGGDIDFSPGYICGPLNVQTDGIEYYDSNNPFVFQNDAGNDVAVLDNGDIMVVGTSVDTTGNADVYRTALLKVHADNAEDATFGLGGFQKPYVGSFFRRMLVQGGDRIIAVGGNYNGALALARFNTDGVLDASFGDQGGFSHTTIGSFSTNPNAMAVQTDGRILVVGTAVNNNNDVAVARYNGTVVGVNESDQDNTVRVFPNPSSGSFTVQLPIGSLRLSLSDAAGRIVVQHELIGRTSMQLEIFRPGIYHLVIESTEGRSVQRVVVIR